MKNSGHLKDLKTIQKIGIALILLASIMTLLRIFDVLPYHYYSTHDLRNYIYLLGALLFVIPKKFKTI